MQTTRLSRSIYDDIDRKIRRFLWGGIANERKAHLVHWNSVTKPKELGGLGLCAMRQLNSVHLAKLGGRVMNEIDSLWTRALRSKYCKVRCRLEDISMKTTDSHTWRGIAENINILCKGLGVVVGDGRTTHFWTRQWTGPKALIDLTAGQTPSNELSLLVCDYWEEGRGWKWEKLTELISEEVLKSIASFELISDNKLQDQFFSRGTSSGQFTLKSALLVIYNEEETEGEVYWLHLWKLTAPQTIKVFAWLALHDLLMTNINRINRGLTDNPFYAGCEIAYEDVDHVLRACPRAKAI